MRSPLGVRTDEANATSESASMEVPVAKTRMSSLVEIRTRVARVNRLGQVFPLQFQHLAEEVGSKI